MADTKPVETAPVAEPVVDTKTTEEAAAAPAVTEAAAPVTEVEAPAAAAETTEPPAAVDDKNQEETKPVEEGALSHKGEGANFPKNLIHSKKFFWFGSDAVDLKAASHFKADKVADVAHHITAWAAETGKGLLFFGEKDKSAPQGAIHLAEASEPQKDGANKFAFTANGHKHSFKAATAAERDAWVAQLDAKIKEAKALAATVTESEAYKKTLEALKPAPKKEEKKAEPAAEPAPEATTETTEAAAVPAVEAAAVEASKEEEVKKEEPKEEEPKRRSASRKRTSIFGNLLGRKEEKKVEAAAETKAVEPEAVVAETSAAAAEPAAETAAAPEVAAVTETPAEDKKEEKEEAAEVKPTPTKRSSLFGHLSFGKKKVASPEPTPTTEEAPATEPVAETAPVIPAVETTEPLTTEAAPAADDAPAETTEAAPATNGETKKEVKSDKRKSSLPFVGAFLNKEKATSGDEAEKPKSPSPFSKLRATIKGKKAEKPAAEEKAEEKTEETPAPASETAAPATGEAPKPAETEAAAPEEPAKTVQATPAVTAAA